MHGTGKTAPPTLCERDIFEVLGVKLNSFEVLHALHGGQQCQQQREQGSTHTLLAAGDGHTSQQNVRQPISNHTYTNNISVDNTCYWQP
jgi:hypothetical protein